MANPMDLYNRIKGYGSKARLDAEAFIRSLTEKYTKENPAPDEVVQKSLEGILAKHQPKAKNPVISNATSDERWLYAAGLAGIALLLGMPYL